MKSVTYIALAVALTTLATQANALSMGPGEFAAARSMTCVLAQESLGYLSSDEYASLSEETLKEYDQAETDIIYAKALGYYDGLMFGLNDSDQSAINERLRQFVESGACTQLTGYRGVGLTL